MIPNRGVDPFLEPCIPHPYPYSRHMSFMKEFKEFAIRGNVVDIAVGLVIGAAFATIVSSLVDDVLMPPIGLLVGGVDFSNLAITLREAMGDEPAVTIGYGRFIQSVVDFTIVAFAIFAVIKGMNKLERKKAEEVAPEEDPAPSDEVKLLSEIRDLLRR